MAETLARSLDEIRAMLEILPEPSRTIVGVTAYAGSRRSEMQGQEWRLFYGITRLLKSIFSSFSAQMVHPPSSPRLTPGMHGCRNFLHFETW